MTLSGSQFSAAVVIPAYAESALLSRTLESLNRSFRHSAQNGELYVVVVINQPLDASVEKHSDNQVTLEILEKMKASLSYELVVLGQQIWELKNGVGEARKLGMDYAVETLLKKESDRLLSLDADCLVAENYVEAILNHPSTGAGFTLDFEHRSESVEGREAIAFYEKYLAWMKEGLEKAGSPYAHFTIGSCLGTDVRHYKLSGGMPAKNATEDFHFMSKLRKLGPIESLPTKVYPSCRPSDRVYLGTGHFMTQYNENSLRAKTSLFMPSQEAFEKLGKFLFQLSEYAGDPERVENHWKDSKETSTFLSNQGFLAKLQRLKANSSTEEQFQKRVHQLFDGIQTFRFLRFHNNI